MSKTKFKTVTFAEKDSIINFITVSNGWLYSLNTTSYHCVRALEDFKEYINQINPIDPNGDYHPARYIVICNQSILPETKYPQLEKLLPTIRTVVGDEPDVFVIPCNIIMRYSSYYPNIKDMILRGYRGYIGGFTTPEKTQSQPVKPTQEVTDTSVDTSHINMEQIRKEKERKMIKHIRSTLYELSDHFSRDEYAFLGTLLASAEYEIKLDGALHEETGKE